MSDVLKKYWLIVIGAILGMALLMFSNLLESTLLGGVGLALIIPTAVYLFLYKFKWLYYLMIVTLPLSVHLSDIGLGIGLSLPGEALLIFVFIGVVWRMIFRFEVYKPIIFHPISFLILAHIIWMVVCSASSVLPSVSLKFDLIRIIYIIVFYVYGTRLLLEHNGIQKFTVMYILGMLPIIGYTLMTHFSNGMSPETANRTCYPFFNDHTIYAACIVMLIPLVLSFLNTEKFKSLLKIPTWLLTSSTLIILITALYFSFSRAGWLSLIIGLLLSIPLLLKLKLKWFIGIGSSLAIALLIGVIILKPKPSVNHSADVKGVVTSIFDTKKNYSNVERLNRWKSAFEMFKERPITGFGPGTFMFVYAHYQKDKTFISVSDASMGGAHSEYLKPLSEQGLLGLLFFLAIIMYTHFKGYNLAVNSGSRQRIVLVGCLTALVTYYIHGVFNFFLDTDKSSILFWGLIGYVVTQDLIKTKKISTTNK